MGRPLWTPPQGKDLDEKPPVPPACLTPSTAHYNFFRPGGRTPPTTADNFPSYSSASSSSSSSSGGPTLGQTLGLRHSRLTDDDQQRRSRSTRNDDMVMRNDSSMLTLDEFLRETSAASATRDEAERHLHNLLNLRRRIGSERPGTERAAPPGETTLSGGTTPWRNLFEHTPAGRRRILGAIPLDPEYVSRAPRNETAGTSGRDNEIPGRPRETENPRDLENMGLTPFSRDEILSIPDVSWRSPISRDVEIARATIPRARGDVQITWRPSVPRSTEISQRSRDAQEPLVLTPEGRLVPTPPPLRDTAPPAPVRRLTAHLIPPSALQPTRAPGQYTPSRTTPVTTTWPPPPPPSSLPPLSQQDSFDTLVGQIRRIGALQDFMLSSVDSATASLEDSEAGESESTPGEDRERNVFASLRVREARLRAMQSRIDLLASEFALLSNTRRELRRVEAEAMESLQETSVRNRAAVREASMRGMSLREARNNALLSVAEADAGRSRTREAMERYVMSRRGDEYSSMLAGIPVVRVGRRVNVQEGDARRWTGGVEAGREGQSGATRRQREDTNMMDWTSGEAEGVASDGRMTAGLREALMRSVVMRMQIEALPAGTI